MSTILITGATGYIGRRLTGFLAAKGHTIHALCRNDASQDLSNENITIEALSETRSLSNIFAETVFDEVIHLATFYTHDSSNDIDKLIDSNISLGISLIELMLKQGCRKLINTTTCAEFSSEGKYQPNSLYAASKYAYRCMSEYYSNCHDLKVIDLVLYDNYGPEDPRRKIITLLCDHIGSSKAIELSPGDQYLNLVYIDDTVRAIAKARDCFDNDLTNNNRAQFCVAPDEPITLKQLASEIETVAGNKINALWGAKPYRENEIMTPWRGKNVPHWSANTPLHQGIKSLLQTFN